MKSTEMPRTPINEVYRSIVEGRAVLRLTTEKVFYNPVQEFNRDLSIAVLTVFTEEYKQQKLLKTPKGRSNFDNENDENDDDVKVDITILEALSATGLRSIRYAKEVVDATKIIANDISAEAVETIKYNVSFNNVDHIIETSHEDACLLMYKHKHWSKRFTAVDLDPYGSPTIFLDAAVQSVVDGGLLLVTATDMAVLAGNVPETCYNKYGAISLRTKSCHEMAIRILLQCIEAHANKYTRYIVPMLSISADFYVRVFVKVYSGAGKCKETTSKVSMVYRCVGCDATTLQPLGGFKPNPTVKRPDQMKTYLPNSPPVKELCENCNQVHQLGGPIWSAPIHDEPFVARVLQMVQENPGQFQTSKRLEGMLSVVREELYDAPLYYTLNKLCGTVHSEMMPILTFRSALLNAGYNVSYSHANKLSIKTKAPSKLVWDIMRTWIIKQPVKAAKVEADPVAKHILSQPITYKVDLTEREDANPSSRKERQTRFQFNPTPHWGPGSRSRINTGDNKNHKSKRNQNKNKMKKYKNKRLLSPPESDVGRKKPNSNYLVIDTTVSEPDSDDGKEPEECNKSIGADVAPDKCDTNIVPADPENDNGTTQPDTIEGTSKTPTDSKE